MNVSGSGASMSRSITGAAVVAPSLPGPGTSLSRSISGSAVGTPVPASSQESTDSGRSSGYSQDNGSQSQIERVHHHATRHMGTDTSRNSGTAATASNARTDALRGMIDRNPGPTSIAVPNTPPPAYTSSSSTSTNAPSNSVPHTPPASNSSSSSSTDAHSKGPKKRKVEEVSRKRSKDEDDGTVEDELKKFIALVRSMQIKFSDGSLIQQSRSARAALQNHIVNLNYDRSV